MRRVQREVGRTSTSVFLEGRRRHILEEYTKLKTLEQGEKSVLVVGAGFIGVEWVTELNHFFPKLKLTIIDFLPLPLGPLPPSAAKHCQRYMKKHKIISSTKRNTMPKVRNSGNLSNCPTELTKSMFALESKLRTTSCPLTP